MTNSFGYLTKEGYGGHTFPIVFGEVGSHLTAVRGLTCPRAMGQTQCNLRSQGRMWRQPPGTCRKSPPARVCSEGETRGSACGCVAGLMSMAARGALCTWLQPLPRSGQPEADPMVWQA